EGFELGYLAPFLPAGYGVSGAIDATGSVRQEAGGAPTGELEIVTEGGEIVVGAEESDAVRLAVEPSHARLALLPDRTNADVDLRTERGHLRLRAEMPSFDGSGGDVPVTERTLDGAVTIDIPDLSFVADLVPDLTEVAGAISGNIDLGGTLDSPALTGTIMLEGGAATVPAAGLTLTDLAASVVGRGGDGIEVAASAGSGGGNVTLAGALTLLGDVPNARLEIRGDEFQLSNTRDARLYVTPTLDVTADAARI